MVKKVSRMLSALMIVLCVFILSACGSSSGGSNPAGSYEMTAAASEGDGSAAEQFEMMKEYGMSATLDLEDDGTGLLNMFGTAINVSWDKDAKTIKVYDQDMEYTYESDVFTFIWENTKLEFTKTE